MVIEQPKLPRSFVQTVECPNCHAAAGAPCVGARDKPRESNHAERVYAADAKRNGQQVREHRYYDDGPEPRPRDPNAISRHEYLARLAERAQRGNEAAARELAWWNKLTRTETP